MDPDRLLKDSANDSTWLRIEDAGYMDEGGRIWLVGRVKWRVERDGRAFWSTVVEQKVSCSAKMQHPCMLVRVEPFRMTTFTHSQLLF